MKTIQVTLLTGRSLSQGREKEQGKLSESYFKSVACCEINGEDIKEIGLDYGELAFDENRIDASKIKEFVKEV